VYIINDKLNLGKTRTRIISLVPSITELLYYLGLENNIVGVTSFCVHPPQAIKQKTLIGGIFKLKFDVIENLKPDLIIASKEENKKEEIELLMQNYNVLLFDVKSFDDAILMIKEIGRVTEKQDKADLLCKSILNGFSVLPILKPKPKVVCLIWKKPFISLSHNTYINSLLEKLNFTNLVDDKNNLYPEITVSDLKFLSPDILFLLSEPCYFDDNDKEFFENNLPSTKVMLVDGEMFAWYGSRMDKASLYFTNMLNKVG